MFLFLTHHKCASKWFTNILSAIAEREQLPFHAVGDTWAYPAEDEHSIFVSSNASYELLPDYMTKAVHVIRNPLDLICSAYYSHKSTHAVYPGWQELLEQRSLLNRLPKDQGMYATHNFLERYDFHSGHVIPPLYSIRTWQYEDNRILTLTMEDLIADPVAKFSDALVHLGLNVPSYLADICEDNKFDRITAGRKKGEIDNNSHYRSGKRDTWRSELPTELAVLCANAYWPLLKKYYPYVLDEINITSSPMEVLSNEDFVRNAFIFMLRREPTKIELDANLKKLAGGHPPVTIFTEIYMLPEALLAKHKASSKIWLADAANTDAADTQEPEKSRSSFASWIARVAHKLVTK